MKRRLTLLMAIIMLLTSLLGHHVPVYAEEETGTENGGIDETVEVSEQEEEDEEDDETVFAEEEQSEDEQINEEEPETQEEESSETGETEESEESENTEGEEPPAETDSELEDELIEEELNAEIDQSADELMALQEGLNINYDSSKGLVFSYVVSGQKTDIPWASSFMGDPNATITLKGSENYKYVYKNVHATYSNYELIISNKVLKYSNIPSEKFKVTISSSGETYQLDLSKASINTIGNSTANWKFRAVTWAGPSFVLTLGKFVDSIGESDPWLKAVRKTDGQWVGGIYTGSHMDILDENGNILKSYYYIGKTALSTIYFDNLYYLSHHYGVEIDVRKLIDDKIPGGTLTVRVCAPGYTAYTAKVDLEALVQKADLTDSVRTRQAKLTIAAPNDITVDTTDEGDLIIESSNKAWLKALSSGKYGYKSVKDTQFNDLPAKTNDIGGGYIKLAGTTFENTGKITNFMADNAKELTGVDYFYVDDNSADYKFYKKQKKAAGEEVDYSEYAGSVIIPNELILENEITNGGYSVELTAEGYFPYTVTANLNFHNEAKEISASKVVLSLDNSGNLIITCNDNAQREDFYDSLIKEVKGTRLTSGGRLVINGVDLYNKAGTAAVIYKENGHVKVDADTIKNLFNGCISGSSNISVCAKGYYVVDKSIVFPYIRVAGNTTDDGKTIYLGESKTYEVANSSGITWSLSKKQGNNFVELGSDDHITLTTSGNKATLSAQSFGTFRLQATVSSANVVDFKEITVSAEGLEITAPAKAEGVVGVQGHMAATAKIGGGKDVTSFLAYRSSDESIATVDDSGSITFLKKGTVTIFASIADVEAKTVYSVYQYNKNAELTATFVNINNPEDVYASGMEIGEKYQMHLYANGVEVDPGLLTFKSANTAIAAVDETGVVEAKKLGTVSITATLNDFEKRNLSKSVKVINKVFYSLDLEALGVTDYTVVDGVCNLFFDANAIPKDPITLKATGTDINHHQFETKAVSYTSSDPTIVSVTSSGVATIKKAGEVTITAKITTNPKEVVTTKDIVFRVLDFTPRISSKKLTINKYLTKGAELNISSAYTLSYPDRAAEITKVSLSNTEDFVLEHVAGDEYLINIAYPNDIAKINALKSGTCVLTVDTADGKSYIFDLAITVTAKKPAVTVKTTGTFNTFTNVNTLGLTYSSKTADIINVEPQGTWAVYDKENNIVTLNPVSGKYVSTGTIRFYFDGYNDAGYVDQKVTFKTVATKPSVKLETASVKLYVPKESPVESKDIPIHVVKKDGVSGKLTMNGKDIPLDEEGYGKVTISPVTSKKIILDYVEERWTGPISLTLNVTVNNIIPTAKLGASTLALNPTYKKSGSVILTTNIKTENISGVDFTSGEDKFNLSYSDGNVFASLKEGVTYDKPSYKVTMVPKVCNNTLDLKPVTLTISVSQTDPKINLSAAMVRLNSKYVDLGSTKIKSPDKLTYGVKVVGIGLADPLSADVADFTFEDNTFKVKLKESAVGKKGSFAYNIYPKFDNGHISSTPVKVNVVLYNVKATATVTVKGSLNQLDRNAKAEGTVKVSNLNKKVRSILCTSDVLNVVFDEESGKLSFSLKDTAEVVKDQILKQAITFVFDDLDTVTSTVSVKIARKAPTIKASPAEVLVYNSTNKGALIKEVELVQSGTVSGQIKKVTIENVPAAYTVVSDPEDINKIKVYMKDASLIKAGLTKTVTVKVDWVGDYGVYGSGVKLLKTSTVKLTLKDISGTIKSK